jgi:polyphosphate kinase
MLKDTNHDKAPWHIIRSSDKHKARVETMKLILNHIDYDNRSQSLDFIQDPKIVFSSQKELAIMDKHI